MSHKFVVALVIAALTLGAPVRGAESLRIVPQVRNGQVFVSFELTDAYTGDLRDAIASGLRTTLTYSIELRMVVPTWIDRTVTTAVVGITDRYDNLTRRHNLSRVVDGRVVDELVTEDESVARQWLMRLDPLPLYAASRLEPNRSYYVRVSARARPHGSLLGWTNAIIGQANVTRIPVR
jgi:hypothetical protein